MLRVSGVALTFILLINMNTQTSAGIIVYQMHNHQPFYLLLHYTAGHWDFSKGHLDPGETFIQAADRELKEETGLTADVISGFEESFSYFLNDPHTGELALKTVHFFVGHVTTDQVILSSEHIDYTWLPYEKALDKLTYDNARHVLRKAHSYITMLKKG